MICCKFYMVTLHFCKVYFSILCKNRPSIGMWIRYQMTGKGDWNASGECWTVRCADCQSMVPDLTQAADSMNKRRTLMVIFNEVSARIKLRRVWNTSTLFWGEWKAMTCRYRFILMEANTRRETSMVSLMEFNDSIRVLSPFVIKARRNPHYFEKANLHFRQLSWLSSGVY